MRNKKPISPLDTYVSHIIWWFVVGLLIGVFIVSVADKDWALVGVCGAGAGLIAWGAYLVARERGYINALYKADIESNKEDIKQI